MEGIQCPSTYEQAIMFLTLRQMRATCLQGFLSFLSTSDCSRICRLTTAFTSSFFSYPSLRYLFGSPAIDSMGNIRACTLLEPNTQQVIVNHHQCSQQACNVQVDPTNGVGYVLNVVYDFLDRVGNTTRISCYSDIKRSMNGENAFFTRASVVVPLTYR